MARTGRYRILRVERAPRGWRVRTEFEMDHRTIWEDVSGVFLSRQAAQAFVNENRSRYREEVQ